MISCRRLDIGVTEGRIQEHTAHKHGGQSATTFLHFLRFLQSHEEFKAWGTRELKEEFKYTHECSYHMIQRMKQAKRNINEEVKVGKFFKLNQFGAFLSCQLLLKACVKFIQFFQDPRIPNA